MLPFARHFYASLSKYVWHDEHGIVHDVPQGEQGDALFSLLVNTPRWKLFSVSCSRVRRFAFSSTICTPSAALTEPGQDANLEQRRIRTVRLPFVAAAAWRTDPTAGDGGPLEDGGPGLPSHGWQCEAAETVEGFFLATSVWPQLPDQDRAMLRSQGGPMAGLPLTCCPTLLHSRLDAQVFRVLFLRRLWLPLPPHFAHMLVWPSSRRPWPPPCIVQSVP